MKILKIGLNLWITLASIASFLIGWIALGHAPKPVQPATPAAMSVQALPTLQPLQFLPNGEGDEGGGMRSFQAPSGTTMMPIFRTGGS